MRNPRWTWTAALAAMGLAASSPWIDAQTNRGLEPGANPNVSPMDPASVQIAPAGNSSATARKPAAPVMEPGDAAMLRSRSARTVLRNGIDYIKYQQYEKALVYLREAERRKDQLNPAEVTSLRQGIEAAQEGLRAPTSMAGYAKTRRPQAGSIAVAAKLSAPVALADPAMIPASVELPIQESQPVVRTALEPIPPEALAKALPTASELARSKSAASARRQYDSAGNSGGSEPLPPLSAPASLTLPLKARETEPVAVSEPVVQEQAPVMESVAARLPNKVTNAPEPLPGSPSARSSVAQPSAPTLDASVAPVTDDSKPAHQVTPTLPALSVPPGAVEETESAAPEPLPVLPLASSQPAPKLESVNPDVKSNAPVVETPALPAVNSDDEPIDNQPPGTEPSLPALPPLEVAEVKAKVEEKVEAVAAPAEPVLPTPTAKLEAEPGLPALPAVEVAQVVAEPAKAPVESKVMAKLESEPSLPALPVANPIENAPETSKSVELEVKPATVQLPTELPPAGDKPLQEVGGIPVLTPLADDEEPAAATTSNTVQAERIATRLVDEDPKPSATDSLPPLPTAPANDLPPLPPIPSLDQPPLKSEEPAKPAGKPVSEPAPLAPEAGVPAKPELAGDLPPLPVGASSTPDTPPVPPVAPTQAEAVPERVARAEANPAPAATSDNLPALPAEEVAKTVTPSPSSPDGDPEIGKITDKYLGGLSFERRREIEQMARIQGGRTGSTPGLSALGAQPPEEAGAAAATRPGVPGSSTNMSATDDPLVRLELPRAPSPAEARPIRAILLPEQFDSLKPRQFDPRRKMWASAAVAHYPLYFQDPSLERYGVSVEQRLGRAGRKLTYPIDDPKQSKLRNQIATPMISSGLFALQIATFPFRAIADPPWESEYDLGYYRPGDVVPEDTVVLPWKGVGPLFKGNKY